MGQKLGGTLLKVDQTYVGSFLNVMLEKEGEDQLDPSCEELKSIALS